MKNNIRFDCQNYYAYIGVTKGKEYEPYTLLVDTNTAINLEKFYYNPASLIQKDKPYSNPYRSKKWKSTMQFLIDNINKDIIYGFALQEACWDYETKCLNKRQYQKMEAALIEQYEWDCNDIIMHAYSKGHEDKFKPIRNKVRKISTLIDQDDCNPEILSSYACVLKIMILQRTIKSGNKVKSYMSFMEFIVEKLNAVHAIEANIATNYFLGKPEMQEIGDKIFKFGKKDSVLLNAWNTCWDIFYLRFLQKLYYDKKFKSRNPKLITADLGLISLARMTSLEIMIKDDEGMMPVLSFYESDIREEYIDIVKKYEKNIYFDTVKRKERRRNIQDRVKYLKEIIKSLEAEILFLYEQN